MLGSEIGLQAILFHSPYAFIEITNLFFLLKFLFNECIAFIHYATDVKEPIF